MIGRPATTDISCKPYGWADHPVQRGILKDGTPQQSESCNAVWETLATLVLILFSFAALILCFWVILAKCDVNSNF